MCKVLKIQLKVFVIILMISSICMKAQEDNILQQYEIKQERILGVHYFTPGNVIKAPFILTHVRTSLGLGGVNGLKYPLINLGDKEFIYMQGDILAAVLQFEYQHAVKEWLAVFARFGLTARIGSSMATLTTQGINYATTFNVGWMIKLYRHDKFALSTSVEVTSGNYALINLQEFVNDIVEGKANPRLLNNTNAVFGHVGLRPAYGINRFLGFNAVVDLGYGETIAKGSGNKFFTVLGINADMNFYPLIETPVALLLGYLYSSYPEENPDAVYSTHAVISQISYIGRSDFILSLDLMASRERTKSVEETVWLTTTMFSMKYLF